jgi:short-subunit dehydrogenase
MKDKVIWITGGGRGIGRSTAEHLARLGARVVICARTKTEIDAVADNIRAGNGQILSIPCDVTENAQIQRLISQVKKKWGSIDVLINNAGVGIFRKIMDTDEADWDKTLNINLKSVFLCSRAVLPDMISKKSGHIINVVSVAGKKPYYNCGMYCASKYGMLGFTDVLRLEVRKYGIHVTAFLPGATDTSIWEDTNADRSKMMTPDTVAQGLADICQTTKNTMVEEIILRPIGGDL